MASDHNAAIGEIVEAISASAVDETFWARAVEKVAAFVPGSGVSLQIFSTTRPDLRRIVHAGYEQPYVDTYRDYYCKVNAWLPDMQRMAAGQILFTDQTSAAATLHSTEFYNDWLRPQGHLEAGGAIVFAKASQCFAILCVNGDERDEDGLRAKLKALFPALLGPAQQALSLARLFPVAERLSEDLIEALEHPAVMLDADLKVVSANSRFEGYIKNERALELDRSGCLRVKEAEASKALEREVKRLTVERAAPCPMPIVVRRASSLQPLFLRLSAFPNSGKSLSAPLLSELLDRHVLVVVVDPVRRAAVPEDVLRQAFGLTRAECAVANALLEGATLEEYADAHRISKLTARNQLRAVSEKLGARRQSDVVRVLLRVAEACRSATPPRP